MSEAYRYQAFVSYSHADRKWGEWVHRALEGFVVPAGLKSRSGQPSPKRLAPVFRDREELSSSADLGAQIADALAGSRALVVVCSPRSARSRWVNEEVRQFKAMGRGARIYCLVVDGAPNATDRGAAEQECFPPAVRHDVGSDGELLATRCEPMAADVRAEADGRTLGLLKVVAGMLEVDLATLTLREQRRRRQRLIAGASLVLAVLALVLSQQIINGREVARERDQTARRLAESLIARAAALMSRDHHAAAKPLLADARSIVSKLGESTLAVDFGRQLVVAESPDPLAVLRFHQHEIRGLAVSADGATAVSLDAAGVVAAWRVSAETREPLWTAQARASGQAIGLEPSSGLVVTVLDDGFVDAFRLTDGQPAGQWQLGAPAGGRLKLASIDDDGALIAAAYAVDDLNGGVHGVVTTSVVDAVSGPKDRAEIDLATLETHRQGAFEFAVRPAVPSALLTRTRAGQRELLVGMLDGVVILPLGQDGLTELRGFSEPTAHAPMQPHAVVALGPSPDGEFLGVATSDNAFDLWDARDAKRLSLRHFAGGNDAIQVVSSDPLKIAIGGGDGSIGVLTDDERSPAWTLNASTAGTTRLLSTGALLVAGKQDGSLELWSTDAPPKQATLSDLGLAPTFDESPHGPLVVSGPNSEDVLLMDPQRLDVIERVEFGDIVFPAYAGPTPRTLWLSWNDEVVGYDFVDKVRLFSTGPSALSDVWAVTPDRQAIVMWRSDGTLEALRWGGGERRALGKLAGEARLLEFDRDGKFVALAAGNEVQLFTWPEWRLVMSKKLASDVTAEALALSFDARRLALALDNRRVIVLRVPEGELDATMIGHSVTPSALAFATDAPDVLVSASQDGSVRLWNANTGVELVGALGISPVMTLEVTRSGKVLAGAIGDSGLYGHVDAYVWDTGKR